MPRTIIHLDLDAFYCAVEELAQPNLKGRPFAVGGRPSDRGVVASCSYPARHSGVRSAMPMAHALRMCPGLIIVPSHHDRYAQASRQVMEHLFAVTPRVEQISIDEAFLDVSSLPEGGECLAHRLQQTIREQCCLPCSLGVASNKLVAKIANDFGKSNARGEGPPNAITVVAPGQEAEFLSPLPVIALWGIGPKTAGRLGEMGIHTIGELARQDPASLVGVFGKHGSAMALRAQGIDDSPLVTWHETRSISQEVTFRRDVSAGDQLQTQLHEQAGAISRQLHELGTGAATVKLKLRWSDFTTLTRQLTLSQSTDREEDIYQAALLLLSRCWTPGRPVRLIGLGVSGFKPPGQQLSLWENISGIGLTDPPGS